MRQEQLAVQLIKVPCYPTERHFYGALKLSLSRCFSEYGRRRTCLALSASMKLAFTQLNAYQPLRTVSFRILITGSSSGLVETITDAVSIHSIKKAEYARRLAEGRFGLVTLHDHFVNVGGFCYYFVTRRTHLPRPMEIPRRRSSPVLSGVLPNLSQVGSKTTITEPTVAN